MTKHIHVHIGPARTKDAGPAHDPSNGQFTTTSGNAAHHQAQADKHDAARKALPFGHEHSGPMNSAARAHEAAAIYLHASKAAHGAGYKQLSSANQIAAQEHANKAVEHEKGLSKGAD